MNSILTLFSFFICSFFFGQAIIPEFNPLFLQDEVAIVKIEINPDSLDLIFFIDSLQSNHEYPATFIYQSANFSDTVSNVGFRLRGNTSRSAQKKSFKVSFNTFNHAGSLFGIEKMNLNGGHNDPSMLREKLCWDFIRHQHLAGSRTSFIKLYINEEYRGLYLNVEHIDENFLKTYFSDDSGNLYKCLFPASLDYWGENPNVYKEEFWGRRAYELKTNVIEDDYSDLAHFIDVLNNTPIDELECELEALFNVSDYLKLLAIEVLIGHWDGYAFNKNNFYLYFNKQTNLFEYLHYDLDNTFGIDWYDEDWSSRDVYNWSNEEYRPLFERLMDVNDYRNQYSEYLKTFSEEYFNTDNISNLGHQWEQLIEESALDDPYRIMDYGFESDDFLSALDSGWGGHVPFGVIEYTANRVENLLNNLDEIEANVSLSNIRHRIWQPGEIAFRVVVEGDVSDVELRLRTNGFDWLNEEMFDDGIHQDGIAGDQIYGAILSLDENIEYIDYQIVASSSLAQIVRPCQLRFQWIGQNDLGIVINELMSSNSSIISDEFEEYDDWVELYNHGSSSISLGNKFLTDDFSDPGKWRFPQVTLDPGDFQLFWLDDDTQQSPMHANFKLSSLGEECAIFSFDNEAWHFMDYISFGPLENDVSLGRQSDGNTPWIEFSSPTPNTTNIILTEIREEDKALLFWPNPTSSIINFGRPISGKIFDLRGRQIFSFTNQIFIRIETLIKGIYFMQIEGKTYRIIVD